MIVGLGTSGPQVIEHFHGVKFDPPLTRMKEYIEIINTLMRNEPLKHSGKVFNLQRGFTLRFNPVRNHIPIYLATLNAKSIAGWLALALVIWWVIESPTSAAHVVHNIGTFLSSAASGITTFFASI